MNEMADRHEAHKDAQYQLLQKSQNKNSIMHLLKCPNESNRDGLAR